jgi:hypothetical protein
MSMVWVQIELRNNTILRYIGFFIFSTVDLWYIN